MVINNRMHPNYAMQTNQQSQVTDNQSTQSFDTMIQQLRNQLLSSLDTNKDGKIDKNEFSNATKRLSKVSTDPDKVFKSFDKNSDGFIDKGELSTILQQAFTTPYRGLNPFQQNNSSTHTSSANDMQSDSLKNALSTHGNVTGMNNGRIG